jgi:hypothetical protein
MKLASIGAATDGSVIANATLSHHDFIGFWRTGLCQ